MKKITSLHHPLVRYLVRLKEEARFRRLEKSLLLEGRNCIEDVCARLPAKRFIAISEELIPTPHSSQECLIVSEQILKKISSVEQSDGLIAEFPFPDSPITSPQHIVACDRIQDPGNLGTLIRSCVAFGWQGLFLLPGCCDPFNDKALRSAKGATFFLPIQSGSWDDLAAYNLKIVVADVTGEKPDHFSRKDKMVLVLGNEAQGVSIPPQFAHKKVALKMPGPMESLNVAIAGSILMYLL